MPWGYSVPQNLGFPAQEMVMAAFPYNSSLSETPGFSARGVSRTGKILKRLQVDDLVQTFPTVCFECDSGAGTLLPLCWAIIWGQPLLFRISALPVVSKQRVGSAAGG